MIYVASFIVFIVLIFGIVLHLFLEKKRTYDSLKNKHVVITGGSSGIGKSVAVEVAKRGAHVTIIGRDIDKLKIAINEVNKHALFKDEQKIQYAALDVTEDYKVIEKCLSGLEESVGPIFMLVNCAGMCICGRFEDMAGDDIKHLMNLNYLGTAYPTKYVLPGMKARKEGVIVLVSTEAALLGIYGYTAYAAAKWAVRGLAESLMMELVGTGVQLTMSFPPDTDTPGFKTEELTKPKETKLISGAGSLFSPDDVGKKLVRDALAGKTYSVVGLSGNLMSLLFCGSIESVSQVLIQIFTMGFLRVAIVGFILSFHSIVRDGLKERRQNESAKSK